MKSKFKLNGVISALPTPFLNKKVDYTSLQKLVEFQIKNGIDGFVVNGTTAESPTLNEDEVQKIYKLVREISESKLPIILGTGSNSTEETIQNTKNASRLGADAVLVVVPYYNKPPQRGLVAHFQSVAHESELPVVLYNVPGRTITSMGEETILTLSKTPKIVGIKEASGDINFDHSLKSKLEEDFIFLSGDDPTYISFLKLGGHGVISVMSNAITSACHKWTSLAQQKKWSQAEADFEKYKKLISLMYVEANPIPIKWMLYKMGLFATPEMRLPLVDLEYRHHEIIADEMKKLEMI